MSWNLNKNSENFLVPVEENERINSGCGKFQNIFPGRFSCERRGKVENPKNSQCSVVWDTKFRVSYTIVASFSVRVHKRLIWFRVNLHFSMVFHPQNLHREKRFEQRKVESFTIGAPHRLTSLSTTNWNMKRENLNWNSFEIYLFTSSSCVRWRQFIYFSKLNFSCIGTLNLLCG